MNKIYKDNFDEKIFHCVAIPDFNKIRYAYFEDFIDAENFIKNNRNSLYLPPTFFQAYGFIEKNLDKKILEILDELVNGQKINFENFKKELMDKNNEKN